MNKPHYSPLVKQFEPLGRILRESHFSLRSADDINILLKGQWLFGSELKQREKR